MAVDVQTLVAIDVKEPLHGRNRRQQAVDEPGIDYLAFVESSGRL